LHARKIVQKGFMGLFGKDIKTLRKGVNRKAAG
jgi:hypothetical protein